MIAQINEIAQIWWQWMGSMFWQVSLLIILVAVLDMAIRRWAWPQVRYVLWGLVFLKLIIPPTWQMPTSIVSWIQPRVEKQIPIQIKSKEWTVEETQVSVSGISAQKQDKGPSVTEKPTWQAIGFLTWVAGMIAFAIMLIIKMSRLPRQSKKHDEQNVPGWFHDLLAKTSYRLNLKKAPAIVFSRDLKSPAVYGLFKPVLLLPEGCLDQLTEEQTEHVLIHELCHLKRGDVLVHWFCLLLQIVYWFNPLLIWTRRQMRHVCEVCCDLSVAEILREKTIAYRNTLLATARELIIESVEPSLGLLGIFEDPFRLVSRLKWLEKKTWGNRKRKIAATIITGLIMVICVMPMAGLSQPEDQNKVLTIQLDPIPLESHEKENIHAEMTTMNNKNFYIDFKGNVHLSIGAMQLNADIIRSFYEKDGDSLNEQNESSIQSFIANGNVKIEYEDIIMTSGTALINLNDKIINLAKEPKIIIGGDIFKGDEIKIDCATGTTTVETRGGINAPEEANNNKIGYEKVPNEGNIPSTPIYFDALIMEVDADKGLELDAEPIWLPHGGLIDEGDLYDIERVEVLREPQVESKIEEDDHYAWRIGVISEKTDEGDLYDIEHVEVLREPQNTLGPGSPDLPTDDYDNVSARETDTTEAPAFPFSISLYKDLTSIGGESFSDIENLFESMRIEAGVDILVMPQTITVDNEEIETSWNMTYDKTSAVVLGINSSVMKNMGVEKIISLNITPQNDARPMNSFFFSIGGPPLTSIVDRGAMAMIVSPVSEDAKAEQDNATGKKLYVFLAPHVENL